jgi:hypothetical protein
MYLNIPQFNLFQVLVAGENIKTVLNLQDKKFKMLFRLLNLLEKYEFVAGASSKRPVMTSSETDACKYLDMFFSSQKSFKNFNINIFESARNQINPEPFSVSVSTVDITNAIEPSTLSKIKCLRPRR